MARSLKKGIYIDEKLYKQILKLRGENKTATPVKTWARDCTIFPEMVGFKLDIHNGKGFTTVLVTEDMVGHRVGEFALTRTFKGHAKKGKISKIYGSAGRFIE